MVFTRKPVLVTRKQQDKGSRGGFGEGSKTEQRSFYNTNFEPTKNQRRLV